MNDGGVIRSLLIHSTVAPTTMSGGPKLARLNQLALLAGLIAARSSHHQPPRARRAFADDPQRQHFGRGRSVVHHRGIRVEPVPSIAGYATLGGVFFLISALRLDRA